MRSREPLLVILVKGVDRIPMPAPSRKRGRGRPQVYPNRLIVKALVIMVSRRLYTAYSLLAFLNQDTDLTCARRALLTDERGRFPARRTWERRLQALPADLPGLIGCLGRHLFGLLPADTPNRHAAALDSTPLRAHGGVWHKTHRAQGIVPHSTIDTDAHGSKSGYHGWWYGYKLPLACTTTTPWLPLAAAVTAANVADNTLAPDLVGQLPAGVHCVLGDTHYNDPELRTPCRLSSRWLVASRRGPYPPHDPGVDVRRLFHRLRSKAIEPFNGLFKNVFEWGGHVPIQRPPSQPTLRPGCGLALPTRPALSV